MEWIASLQEVQTSASWIKFIRITVKAPDVVLKLEVVTENVWLHNYKSCVYG